MKLPTYRRISREDMGQDAPDWIGRLIYPINQFFETAYNTLNKNVTFKDNFLSFQKTIQFTTDAAYSSGTWNVISLAMPDTFRVRASGVLILQGGPVDTSLIKNISGIYLNWTEVNRNIDLNWLGGLADATTYSFTFLVI